MLLASQDTHHHKRMSGLQDGLSWVAIISTRVVSSYKENKWKLSQMRFLFLFSFYLSHLYVGSITPCIPVVHFLPSQFLLRQICSLTVQPLWPSSPHLPHQLDQELEQGFAHLGSTAPYSQIGSGYKSGYQGNIYCVEKQKSQDEGNSCPPDILMFLQTCESLALDKELENREAQLALKTNASEQLQ